MRLARIGLKVAATLLALLLLLTGAAFLVLKSGWFHEKVRQRIVAELERVTGGSATLGNFVLDLRLLTVQFQDLTLHGTEPAGAAPLLRAKSIQVGLKIVSFWKRDIDLESVIVAEPRINLIVAADGSTNVPHPKVRRTSQKIGLEPFLDWKVAKFSLENGALQLAEQRSDLNLKGENLRALFSYDFTGPRYKGQLSIQPLEFNARKIAPFNTDVFLLLSLEKNRIEVSSAKFDLHPSIVEASGAIEELTSPKLAFRFTAHMAAEQAAGLVKLRAVRQGIVDLAGSFTYSRESDYVIAASMRGQGIDVEQDGVHVSGARVTSALRFDPRGLEADSMIVDVLGGRFTGRAKLPRLERFVVDGAVSDIPIQQALQAVGSRLQAAQKLSWSGLASGPVHVEGGLGRGPIDVAATLTVAPAPQGIQIQGLIDARYDGRSATLSLGKSYLITPFMRLDVSGALGEQLEVRLASTNLEDLLPAINAFSAQPVTSLPVQLKDGKAMFDGTISGKLSSPKIAGAVDLTHFVYSGISFDRFTGQVTLDESSVHIQDATLARGAAQARIEAAAELENWKPEPRSPITGATTLRGMDLSELLDLAGQKNIPVRGALAVSANVSGTVASPRGSANVTVTKGAAYDEPFDRFETNVDYSPQSIRLRQTKLTAGPAQITGNASFEPSRPFSGVPEFRNGLVRFQLTTNELAIERFQSIKRVRPDLSGALRLNLEGSAAIKEGTGAGPPQALLTSLNGDAAASRLRMDTRAIGNIKATARTEASLLKLQVDSNFLNSNLVASGQWRLEPGYPGEAEARFAQVSLGAVREWLNKSGEGRGLNFDGSAEGTVSIAGSALNPSEWKASTRLSKIELYPVQQGEQRGVGERFTLRNEGPVVVTMAKSTLTLGAAHFSGPLSDFTVSGSAVLEPKTSLNLRVNGGVNLAVLRNFTRDIETSGAVTINTSIRGTPDQPLVNGQVDIQRGELHFADVTTGLSAANGTILFTGAQATIQKLTGQVGGGPVNLGGVIGYAGGELSYRVDVAAKDVRVRYPEGVSTSANADLNLRGTSQRSTLSGTVTVLRTGFAPRTDFSSVLGKASEPVRTPSARAGPLGGMQFDIRIETAPDISFESSLAQDLQVEGSLRLQGTFYNPVLLGRLNILQGEINFFGTQYTVNQGSITFANPIKMEPVLNIDLDTRVQGIDVTLTISGPINKLNITPRSDPPMQYSDVIALLATGSAPRSDPTLAARRNTPQQSFTQLGANALIGQVVANPVSNRLQRFFGVSKLKIDPQFTGVENNPQARLTLEQQVSKNVTFTYITNIATANQLIVRIEWAVNKNWSAIAVRDENGLFGLDFLYKKRFK